MPIKRTKIATYKFDAPLPGPPMILFSDLHLYGKKNSSISVFPEAVEHLFTLLKKYQSRGYELYGLGDILEGWRFNAKQILKQHPDFMWLITRHVHIIRGNHDWDAWKKIQAQFGKETYEFLQVGPIFMSHGHEADPMNKHHAWYSRYATKFAGVLKRAGLDMDALHRRVRTRHKDKLKEIYRTHSLRLQHTIAKGATIFCFGHLHMPYLDTTDPNCVVVNLGSIANYQRAFSYVEITERELILWKIEL